MALGVCMTGTATRYLYLVRHGEATEDESGLTADGRRQAELLGRRLRDVPLTAVHHGPLPRAAQTARLVADQLTDVPLHECDIAGDYVPYVPTADELPPDADLFLRFLADTTDEEAEQGAELARRALEEFTGPVDGDEDRHELVVTHNFLVGWLVREAMYAPRWRWLGLNHGNAALTVIRYAPGRPPVVLFSNDMGHLPDELRWTGFPPESYGGTTPQAPATAPGDFGIDAVRAAARRLSGRVVRTPLLNSPMLDDLVGARVLVKAENLQLTGSFKIRGALNALLTLDEDARRAGLVAYSAGNHGQAVAAAARLAGCPAVVVMPRDAPRVKIDNCHWWGAETVLYDPRTEDRVEIAREIQQKRGMTLIPPFDDHAVMAGQGTAGLEIAEQARELGVVPDALLVNCSGGGLAAGVITALDDAFPGLAHHIVEPAGFDKMARSLAAGEVCANPRPPGGVMDALAGPVPGTRPLAVLAGHDVRGLTVTDDEALAAVDVAHRFLRIVLEPGGAASLAALLSGKVDVRGKTVVLVASGGNVDPALFGRAVTA